MMLASQTRALRGANVRPVRVVVAGRPRAVGARRVAASKRAVTVFARWGTSGGSSAVLTKVPALKPNDAKNYAMNKGYTLLDVRTTQEHNAGSKRWFVSLPFESESAFKSAFTKQYPMKSARIIIADDNGSGRSSSVASLLSSLGYTNAVVLEGGVNAYLKADPLTNKDKGFGKSSSSSYSSSSNGSAPAASSDRFSFASLSKESSSSSSSSSSDRFSFKSSGSSSSSSYGSSSKLPAVKPIDAKKFALDKGYTLLDIRSTQEHNAGSKRWFVSLPFDSESSFKSAFTKAFPMKSARIVLACDDGTDRTSSAASVLSSLGYANAVVLEGGVNAYLRFDPLGPKDKKGSAAPVYKPAASSGASAGSRFGLSDSSSASKSSFSFRSESSSSSSGSSGSYSGKVPTVKAAEAKKLALDKGYSLVDVRSASEHAAASKKWFVNMPVDPESKFREAFPKQFFNKMARVIIACEDGTTRSSTAANIVSSLGYNNVKVLEGGVNALLKYDPITAKDKPSGGAFGGPVKVSSGSSSAPAPAAASSSASDRFSFASLKSSSASSNGASSYSSSSRSSSKLAVVKPADAKKFALDKGYVLLDVRSAREHNANSKKWFVNVPAESESSFKAAIQKQYPFKTARLIIADEAGSSKASLAADVLASLGYTNSVVLEGGISAYLKFDPITAKDKKVAGR